jgi:hypothetical protein
VNRTLINNQRKETKAMSHSIFKWGIAPLVACALLAPTPILAQAVRFKATSWLIAEPLPGIWFSSASGQMFLSGEVHVIRQLADDPRAMDVARP